MKSLNLFCIWYADDVVIVVRGTFINTVCNIMNKGLSYAEKWHNIKGLSVNPQKTTTIAITNMKTLVVDNIRFFNRMLSCPVNVKYLGVFSDSKMNWKTHFDYCLNRGRVLLEPPIYNSFIHSSIPPPCY